MKHFRLALYLLLVATSIGSLWWAWRQQREIEELRTAAMKKTERADLQKRVWDLEKSNRDLRDQLAGRTGGPGTETGAAGAPRDPATPGAGRGGRFDPRRDTAQMLAMRELVAKPEVQALISREQRSNVEIRYAALFKALNLPPDQTEKVKALLVERLATAQDVLTAAFDQGVNPRENADDLRKLMTDAQNDINRSIRSVIGEQGFAQLGTYEQTLPQRAVVNELQLRLSATDVPLSPSQAEQLVQILAANPAPTPAVTERPGPPPGPPRGPDFGAILGGGPGGGPGGAVPPVAVTTAAVAQAQTVLSPVQVRALQQIQQQQQTQQQLRQMFNEAVAGPRPTVPVVTPPRK